MSGCYICSVHGRPLVTYETKCTHDTPVFVCSTCWDEQNVKSKQPLDDGVQEVIIDMINHNIPWTSFSRDIIKQHLKDRESYSGTGVIQCPYNEGIQCDAALSKTTKYYRDW